MQRERPADTVAAKYEKLLQQSLYLHEEFNVEGATIAALYAAGDERAAAERSQARQDVATMIDRFTRDRVAFVRAIERPPTFSRVTHDQETQAVTSSVRTAFGSGDDSGDAASMQVPRAQPSVSPRAELAKKYGYDVIEDDDWLVLKNDAIEIHLVTLPPTKSGIGGSRVGQLAVYDRAGRRLLHCDGAWNQACVDATVQKEIDRLLAAFA